MASSLFVDLDWNEISHIVPCVDLHPNAIHLAYLENGDLRAYLEKNPTPPRELQIAWFQQIARALIQLHDRRILVADIATRSLLLDADLSLQLCDFSEATILPLDTDMELADDDGYRVGTDLGQVGAVMYEVITGQRCEFDLFAESPIDESRASLPRRSALPSTDGLWLGSIIDACWTNGFRDARCLLAALESFDQAPLNYQGRAWAVLLSLNPRHFRLDTAILVSVLAAGIAATFVMGRWTKGKL
ncbi:kinase-like domain-containing protein [Aspergillus karnatakaensis]|uniref:kinase-like domain-containing protein n=1 Tax=Aspergillus karnatakaensis TaxID=1810916 RepID=UPI003CCCEA3B